MLQVHDEGSPRQNMAKVMAAYRASKAALNSGKIWTVFSAFDDSVDSDPSGPIRTLSAVTVSWALDLGPSTGFMFIALHPGGIKTESGLKSYRYVSAFIYLNIVTN